AESQHRDEEDPLGEHEEEHRDCDRLVEELPDLVRDGGHRIDEPGPRRAHASEEREDGKGERDRVGAAETGHRGQLPVRRAPCWSARSLSVYPWRFWSASGERSPLAG